MSKKFNLKINGKFFEASEGETILAVALKNGIDVPHLCKHRDLSTRANCRMCLVSINGQRGLQTACSTPVEDGMEVITESPEIKRARKFNLELIFGEHVEDCPDCVWNSRCDLLKYRKKYNSKIYRFVDRKARRPIYDFGPIVFDQTKCIDCRNCVEVCPTEYLEVVGRGAGIGIRPSPNKKKDCIACGQCVMHCPVGAIKTKGEYEVLAGLKKLLKQKKKMVVVQFAPAIRTSVGEELGLPLGAVATGKLVAGLRRLGFKKVFDTSVGADFVTNEEAGEAVERVASGKNLPVFTSCCPSWVSFLEFNYPEFIKNITSARSPQVVLGGLLKTYWAKKANLKPADIFVVSIMPCSSKKYEVERPEIKINDLKPVDMVLTTRELARFFIWEKINIVRLKSEAADNPFGDPSGAGVIYGASGGVMESALRTAHFRMTGENPRPDAFSEVRGQQGLKRVVLKLCKRVGGCSEIKAAVANGIGNARIILDELKKDPKKYDFVEVMACPGGCVGGGGQSLPSNSVIRSQRAASLYEIDKSKKIRLAHENPSVKKAYEEYFTTPEIRRKIFHTTFGKKGKRLISIRHRPLKDKAVVK